MFAWLSLIVYVLETGITAYWCLFLNKVDT